MSTAPDQRHDHPEQLLAGPVVGEHWTIDLLSWGLPVFGEPIDGLLRELFALGGRAIFAEQHWLPDLDALARRIRDRTSSQSEIDTLHQLLRSHLDSCRATAATLPADPERRAW